VADLDPPPAPMPWRDRIELLTTSPPLTPGRVAAAVVAVGAVLVAGWLLLRTPAGHRQQLFGRRAGDLAASSTTEVSLPVTILVHAAGAVQQPGVYELPGGARVTDLIDAAGGAAPDADLDQLNLAAPVNDGERVYVPRVGEVVAPAAAGAASGTGRVDLNRATFELLVTLPGIGPTTAQAIIDERERRGGFRTVDDLLDVRGIGPSKLAQLRDLVTV